MLTKNTMSKTTKKTEKWNIYLVRRLAHRHNVSKSAVYYALTGKRVSVKSIIIKSEYNKFNKKIESILNNVYENKQQI